jgi:hypothetical protein
VSLRSTGVCRQLSTFIFQNRKISLIWGRPDAHYLDSGRQISNPTGATRRPLQGAGDKFGTNSVSNCGVETEFPRQRRSQTEFRNKERPCTQRTVGRDRCPPERCNMLDYKRRQVPARSATAPYRRGRWIDAARRCVAWLLRVEIGVDEDEVVRWRRPDQLRALRCLAHLGHPQFEQRSRP